MTDAERFEATRLFVAALHAALADQLQRGPLYVPFDSSIFARLAESQAQRGNHFARRFPVFNTVAGKACPDFLHGMTAAQSAGLITRENPSYDTFSVRIAPRIARSLATHEDFEGASELARAYIEETIRNPSLQPRTASA